MSRKKKKKVRVTGGSPIWMIAGSIGKASKADYENWRSKSLYSGASFDPGRSIDPKTLEESELENLATALIKACSKPAHKPKTSRKKINRSRGKAGRPQAPTEAVKDAFYKSWEWRTLRLETMKRLGRECQCCGAQPGQLDASGNKVRICVDHIKPISRFWHLRLDRTNLQILCDECNQGKGNWDHTDFRSAPESSEETERIHGVNPKIVDQLTDHGTGRLQ